MHEIGRTYILNDTWMQYPKGMKVKLMALMENSLLFSLDGTKMYSAIIEVPIKGGTAFKYYTGNDTIVSKSPDLNDETIITFIPLRFLSEMGEEDKYKIIIWNLANKWNVSQTDSYNNWRKSFLLKYGYDIHKSVYK